MRTIFSYFGFFCYFCHHLHLNNKKLLEIDVIYYVLSLLIPAILILLAYIKAQKAIEQSSINHLLQIDERWSSPEIIKAREVIHEISESSP